MTVLDDLETLLDAERKALLSGELDKLHDLLPEKERLMKEAATLSERSAEELRALQDKFERNQILLDSAMAGIRAVTQRLSQLRETAGSFDTYGADGRKHALGRLGKSNVERRA